MAGKSEHGQEHHQEPGQAQPRRGRGFAGMDAERQRQISAEGGRAAHRKGTAHEFDSEEAREAGRKGGQASGGSRRRRVAAGSSPTEGTEASESSESSESSAEESETESSASPAHH
jgi:general stress protein YciG